MPEPTPAVAQSVPAETALRDRIAALAEDLRYVLDYRGPHHAHERPGVWDTSGKPCEHCARLAVVRKNLDAYDADPDAALAVLPAPADRAAVPAVSSVGQAAHTTRSAEWRAAADHLDGLHLSGVEGGIRTALTDELRRLADETQPAEARCGCPHPEGEHSVYGCADGCGCEWMPKRPPMDPVHILGIKPDEATPADPQPVHHAPGIVIRCADCRAKGHTVCMDDAVSQPKGAGL